MSGYLVLFQYQFGIGRGLKEAVSRRNSAKLGNYKMPVKLSEN